MVSRFISKDSNFKSAVRLTKGQAMVRGRDAALRDREILRKRREARKKRI